MLVITRRTGEALEIGGVIAVKVLRIEGGRVQLGIQAPDGTIVDRMEVAVRKRAERIRRQIGRRIQPRKIFRLTA